MFHNIGLLIAVIVAGISFHLQILKEEKFLINHYGKAYQSYCEKARRYI